MGFNGSGIWTAPSLPGSFNPAISGQAATPTDWNTLLAAISTGLSTVICKDGQSIVQADIPFAGFRLKGVGAGVLATDAPNMGQLVSGASVYAVDTGAADAAVIAPSPAISAYAVGQIFRFKVVATNTTTAPTLAVNGLTAGVISWDNGALAAGDLPINGMVQVIVASLTPTFHLQTPRLVVNQSVTGPTTQNFTSGSAATYTTPAGVKWIKVRMVGAGGGGGGIGLTTGPNGSAGGDTIFNSIHATGGGGGTGTATFNVTPGGIAPGAGGTGGTGTATLRITGQKGGQATIAPTGVGMGATGGNSAIFGGGAPSVASEAVEGLAGFNGVANTGGGGGGAIFQGSNALSPASGGGGGEYAEIIISNPAGTYVYTVGAVGAGGIGTGTGATTGGSGAAGFITVEEHYNL